MKIYSCILLSFFSILGCSFEKRTLPLGADTEALYSVNGHEVQIRFQAFYRTNYRSINEMKTTHLKRDIDQTIQFLSGPLTNRGLAGIQKNQTVEILTDKAYVEKNHVMIPYNYSGVWLVHEQALTESRLEIPLPYSVRDLQTVGWKNCTDPHPDHATWSFLWYFWDPSRAGCDHLLNIQYQLVVAKIGEETEQTTESFPEYQNLLRKKNGNNILEMTFAFGYVEESESPDPFKDSDSGMKQFRKFYKYVKSQTAADGFIETPIYQNEISSGTQMIGGAFSGLKNGIRIKISVIAAAGVDQMDIFADSYAIKHEGIFAWFGHSRVGSGFDSDRFKSKVFNHPEKFSISPQYQLIYWAGCNSYSYYTLPFFQMKSDLNPTEDPNGTKALDIISNGLPSLFSFNAFNAEVLLDALLNFETRTSYQTIIAQIEGHAISWRNPVIVNVLGDEDNLR